MEYLTENDKKRYGDITPLQHDWFVFKRKIAAKLHKLAYNLGFVTYPVTVVRYSKPSRLWPGSREFWSIDYSNPNNFGMRSYVTIFNREEATRFVVNLSKRPVLYRVRKYLSCLTDKIVAPRPPTAQ